MALTQIDDRGLKTPIDLLDNEKIRLGTGNDLEIYHDGTNTYLDNNTGQFNLDAASGNAIRFLVDGTYQCQIYTSGIDLPDSKKLRLGDSEDLQLYHDGSNSYLTNDTGVLNIQGGGGNIQLQAVDGESGLIVKPDDAVELYFNGNKKFETSSDGVIITSADDSDCRVKGDFKFCAADGTLEAMFDASTAQLEFLDNSKATFGTGDDLQIYHDGSHSYLYNQTGELKNRAAVWKAVNAANSEKMIVATENSSVELYHDNTKKFETGAVHNYIYAASNGNPAGLIVRNTNTNSTYSHAEVRLQSQNNASYGTIFNDHANNCVRIGHNTHGTTLEVFNNGNIRSQGIVFGSDTAAANHLHDYEEGTWTPTLPNGNSGTNHSLTYAYYTKIGRQVTVLYYMTSISIPNDGATFSVGGLPYTVTSGHGFGNFGYIHTGNYTAPLLPVFSENNSYLYFHRTDGNTNVWKNSDAVSTGFGNTYLLMGGTYFTST